MGLLLRAVTACMTLYATWTASPFRFLAGLIIIAGTIPWRAAWQKSNFKVAHYLKWRWTAIAL